MSPDAADNYTFEESHPVFQPQGMLSAIRPDKYPCHDPSKVASLEWDTAMHACAHAVLQGRGSPCRPAATCIP